MRFDVAPVLICCVAFAQGTPSIGAQEVSDQTAAGTIQDWWGPPKEETEADQAEAKRAQKERADQQARFRTVAEAAVRRKLVDPSSAQFEWPYLFARGSWKPFLGKRVSGYFTCGLVNARNRMGGYSGAATFVAVIDPRTSLPLYVAVSDSRDYDFTAAQCGKSAKALPLAPPETAASTSLRPSVVEELATLQGLLDRGVLTQIEFEAAKAKLLGLVPK